MVGILSRTQFVKMIMCNKLMPTEQFRFRIQDLSLYQSYGVSVVNISKKFNPPKKWMLWDKMIASLHQGHSFTFHRLPGGL